MHSLPDISIPRLRCHVWKFRGRIAILWCIRAILHCFWRIRPVGGQDDSRCSVGWVASRKFGLADMHEIALTS